MRPTRRMLWVALAWLLLGVAAAWQPGLANAWAGFGIALLALAAWDWYGVRSQPPPAAERDAPGSLALGVAREIGVRLANDGAVALNGFVFDHHPQPVETEGLPKPLRVPAGGWTRFAYRLRPLARGDHEFGRVEYLRRSPLGLWLRRGYTGEPQTVRVFPNFAAVARYALLATDHRLSQAGIRKRRRRGEGMEFHQLRDYREGDSMRQVDWKATSRQGRLISREYQDERDQQVVFLIDCGRRMLAKDGELSHFDHCLNASLLLAHVALGQGDAVGLMTFGGHDRRVPPLKGGASLNVLLRAVYGLQPTLASPDFLGAAGELMKHVRKRSLVVIVTNLRDEDEPEIVAALAMLSRRHLVLLASLRERVIGDALNRPVETFDDALTVAATHDYLLRRRKIHDLIARQGVLSADVEPDRLPVTVVNRYLDIKRSGRL